jgi:hypothetical protein
MNRLSANLLGRTTGGLSSPTATASEKGNSTAGVRLRPAVLDHYGAALDPAEFTQPLLKGTGPLAYRRWRGRAQEADHRQLARLLR